MRRPVSRLVPLAFDVGTDIRTAQKTNDVGDRRGVHNPYGCCESSPDVQATGSAPTERSAVEVSRTPRTASCMSSPTAVLRVSRTSPGACRVAPRTVSLVFGINAVKHAIAFSLRMSSGNRRGCVEGRRFGRKRSAKGPIVRGFRPLARSRSWWLRGVGDEPRRPKEINARRAFGGYPAGDLGDARVGRRSVSARVGTDQPVSPRDTSLRIGGLVISQDLEGLS